MCIRDRYIPTEYADPFTQIKSAETNAQQTTRQETTSTLLNQPGTSAQTTNSQGIAVPITTGDEPEPRIEPRVQSRVENNNRKKKVEQLF